MELRDVKRTVRLADLIADPRYPDMVPTRAERWEAHERIERQKLQSKYAELTTEFPIQLRERANG